MAVVHTVAKAFGCLSIILFVMSCGDHSGHQMKTGAEVQSGTLTVSGSWVRAAELPAKTSAVYLTIQNDGTASDTLLSISSDVAEFNELHQSLTEDGISQMRKVDGLPIPAGASVNLEPGGYHIMLIDLKQNIETGATVPITLTFAEAGSVTIEPVAQKAKAGGHDHH